jgi:hypothetical protein
MSASARLSLIRTSLSLVAADGASFKFITGRCTQAGEYRHGPLPHSPAPSVGAQTHAHHTHIHHKSGAGQKPGWGIGRGFLPSAFRLRDAGLGPNCNIRSGVVASLRVFRGS